MRRLSVLALLAAASCGISQGTAIVYSNFGSEDPGFMPGTLWAVYGSNHTYAAHAATFTSSGNFVLTQIDIALAEILGPGHVVVSLQTDDAGAPSGTALTSAIFTSLPSTGPTETLTVFPVNDTVVLEAGVAYWLVVRPNSDDTWAGWNMNLSGSATPMAYNDGSGWSPFTPDGVYTSGAFAIHGDEVPEPASWGLAGAGIAAVAFNARRRKQLRTNLKRSGT